MTKFGKALAALLTVALLLVGMEVRAEISATVERHQVALGDTLRLSISATDGEDVGDIDLRPLEQDFEVLGRSVSTNTSIINGRYSSTVELSVEITPRRQGTLTIPAMRLGGQATNSLQVAVGPPPSGDDGNQAVVFEAEIDRDSVYVQGQLILTLRVQEAINLEDRSITELKLDNAFVQTLEQQSFQRTINGRPRLIHEVRYAIFPEQSGTLTIPVQTYSARERGPRRSFFDLGGGGRQLRRQTEALQVEVLPRPAAYPDGDWLPAGELTLEESWSADPDKLRVGESATRIVTIRGVGLQGAQLPPVMYPATRGLKFYPDQPEIQDSEAASGLVGTRVDSVAIVPTEAGNWLIPELRIPWWDTQSNQLRYAVLPGRELEVVAANPANLPASPAPQLAPAPGTDTAPAGPAISIAAATAGDSRLWQLVSAVTGLGWLLTLAYLFRSRRHTNTPCKAQHPGHSSESRAFKAALAACASGDAAGTRQAIIAWSAQLAPQTPPVSLAQVAELLGDQALGSALDKLDRSLYSGTAAAWDGAALAQCLRQARSQRGSNKKVSGETDFQLYPEGA